MSPSEGEDLAAPHTGGQSDKHRPIEFRVASMLEQPGSLLCTQRPHLAAFDLRQSLLKRVAGISRNQLLLDRPTECGGEHPMNLPSASGSQWAGPAVTSPAKSQIVVKLLDMRGCQFCDGQPSQRGDKVLLNDAGITIIAPGSDLLPYRSEPDS